MAFRRTLRVCSTSVNWEKVLSAPITAENRAALVALRSEVAKVNADLAKFASDPAPIDFASYKSKLSLNPEALTALEAAYKKEVYPAFQASQLVDMAALQSWSAEQVKVAEAVLADTNKELAELNASLEVMMSSRTTIETTVAEKLAARPDLATQIDEEINTHQWNKDT